jgi:hypothetical protein
VSRTPPRCGACTRRIPPGPRPGRTSQQSIGPASAGPIGFRRRMDRIPSRSLIRAALPAAMSLRGRAAGTSPWCPSLRGRAAGTSPWCPWSRPQLEPDHGRRRYPNLGRRRYPNLGRRHAWQARVPVVRARSVRRPHRSAAKSQQRVPASARPRASRERTHPPRPRSVLRTHVHAYAGARSRGRRGTGRGRRNRVC